MNAAVLFISIGVVLLLNNLGVLDWTLWGSIWRLWPIVLIALGLDLMVRRNRPLRAIVAVVLALVVIASAFVLQSFKVDYENHRIAQPLMGATRARVEIRLGAARLKLRANSAQDELLIGSVETQSNTAPRVELERTEPEDGVVLRLAQPDPVVFNGLGIEAPLWELGLTRRVPIALDVESGVSEVDLDLAGLSLSDLALELGVGKVDLTLPTRGVFRAKVKGGVGQATVRIPRTLAARIRIKGGIGAVQVHGDFSSENGTWTSGDFEQSQNRVDLDIDGGIGAIDVIQFDVDEPDEQPLLPLPAEKPIPPLAEKPIPPLAEKSILPAARKPTPPAAEKSTPPAAEKPTPPAADPR